MGSAGMRLLLAGASGARLVHGDTIARMPSAVIGVDCWSGAEIYGPSLDA
jgi:hypothetical protein